MTRSPDNAAVFRWPVRVYYEDTDCGGIVYHTAYLRFMGRARTEWQRQLGFSQTALRQELARVFAVRSLDIAYERPARLDDESLRPRPLPSYLAAEIADVG